MVDHVRGVHRAVTSGGATRRAYLGIGSNLGDRLEHLQLAVDDLAAADGVDLVAVSPVYETEPVGGPEQPDYLNAVVAVDTDRTPARAARAHACDRGPRSADPNRPLGSPDAGRRRAARGRRAGRRARSRRAPPPDDRAGVRGGAPRRPRPGLAGEDPRRRRIGPSDRSTIGAARVDRHPHRGRNEGARTAEVHVQSRSQPALALVGPGQRRDDRRRRAGHARGSTPRMRWPAAARRRNDPGRGGPPRQGSSRVTEVADAGRGADLVIVATPDAVIADTAAALAPSLQPGALVVHLSGTCPRDDVNPILPVIAAQPVAPELVLQPGTVVDAQVLKVLSDDLVRIAIAGLSIDVLSEVSTCRRPDPASCGIADAGRNPACGGRAGIGAAGVSGDTIALSPNVRPIPWPNTPAGAAPAKKLCCLSRSRVAVAAESAGHPAGESGAVVCQSRRRRGIQRPAAKTAAGVSAGAGAAHQPRRKSEWRRRQNAFRRSPGFFSRPRWLRDRFARHRHARSEGGADRAASGAGVGRRSRGTNRCVRRRRVSPGSAVRRRTQPTVDAGGPWQLCMPADAAAAPTRRHRWLPEQ